MSLLHRHILLLVLASLRFTPGVAQSTPDAGGSPSP